MMGGFNDIKYRMTVQTKLMENYEQIENTSGTREINNSSNASEVVQIYNFSNKEYIFNNENDSKVYCYHTRENSNTFSRITLNLAGTGMAVAHDKENKMHVFVIKNNKIFQCIEKEASSGEFSSPVEVDLGRKNCTILKLMIRQASIWSDFSLIVTIQEPPSSLMLLQLSWENNDFDSFIIVIPINSHDKAELYLLPSSDSAKLKPLYDDIRIKRVVTVSDDTIFVLLTDGYIGIVDYETEYYTLRKSPHSLYRTTQEIVKPIIKNLVKIEDCVDFAVTVQKNIFPEIYHLAILTKSGLYHARVKPTEKGGASKRYFADSLCPIDMKILSRPSFAHSGGLNTVSLAYTKANELVRMEYNMNTQKWSEIVIRKNGRPCNAATPGSTIKMRPAYSTEITFLHLKHNIPLSNVDVELWTDKKAYLRTEKGIKVIDKRNKIKLNTGNTGKIYFVQETDSLDVATVYAKIADPLYGGEEMEFRQAEATHEKMANISGEQLRTATIIDSRTGQESSLLENKYKTPQYTDAVAESLKKIISSPQMSANKTKLDACTYLAASQTTSHTGAANTATDSWMLSFSDNGAAFREISDSFAVNMINQSNTTKADITPGNFSHAVTKGFFDIQDIVWHEEFSAASNDKISKIVIKYVAEKGEQFVEWIVKTASDLYDFITMIFNKIKVGFEKLYKWLGFIFNWQDITRTKSAIVGATNCFLANFGSMTLKGGDSLIKGINDAKMNLSQNIDKLINNITNGRSLFAYAEKQMAALPASARDMVSNAQYIVSNDVLQRKISTMQTISLDKTDDWFASSQLNEAQLGLENILNSLTSLSDNIAASEDFAKAKEYFNQAFRSIEDLFRDIFTALLKVLEGLMKLVLDGAETVIKIVVNKAAEIIGILANLISKEIEIPFFTDIYVYITGKKPSLIDIGALIIALPATLIYKLLMNAAPFPDTKDVENYVQWYGQKIIPGNEPKKKSVANKMETHEIVCSIFTIAAATAYCFTATIADGLSLTKYAAVGTTLLDTLLLIFNFVWLGFGVPAIYSGSTGYSWLLFSFFSVGCIADLALYLLKRYVAAKKKKELSVLSPVLLKLDMVNICYMFGYGLIHIALAVAGTVTGVLQWAEYLPEFSVGLMEAAKITLLATGSNIQFIAPGMDVGAVVFVFMFGLVGLLLGIYQQDLQTMSVSLRTSTK